MAIRKLLLPLTGTAAGEAALATALTVARRWDAHVLALHVRVDSRDVAPLAGEGLSGAMIEEMMSATEKESSDRAHAVRSMFERFVARHNVVVQEAHWGSDHATASFAAVTGREEDIVAQQARLADLTVVPHPDAGEDVSSSDALHAVLFEFWAPGADFTAAIAGGHRDACVPGVEWHGRIGVLGVSCSAMDATRRGSRDSICGWLSETRSRGTGSGGVSLAARCACGHRHLQIGRRIRGGRTIVRGCQLRLRLIVDGGLLSFAVAPIDPGRRDPACTGACDPTGDDEPLEQLFLRPELNDHFGRVGEIEHRTGALIKRVGVEMARAQAGHPRLPPVALGFRGGLFGNDLPQKFLPLGVGHEAAVALDGVPAEITGNG